jgi:putative peptide zinc metalloprotease protein
MLPSKWQRIAIGAAGMYVELVLASICTFFWWYTSPGLFNKLCLNVMFISSVSTIFFNANPLLKYDGYYMLADLMEIPNLRQKATQILSRKMSEWFLGMEQDEDPFLPKKNQIFFALYSIASAIYRWIIVLSILSFLYKFWKPYKLEIIGTILGLMSLYGLAVYPLYKVGKFFWVPGRLDKVKKPRFYSTLAGLAVLIAAVLLIPLPHHVLCVVEIQPRDASSVYVEVPGVFAALDVKAGQAVAKGQSIARLENRDLELDIQKLRSECDQARIQLETAYRSRIRDSKAGDSLPQLKKALAVVEQELAQKETDHQRLHLRAPIDGAVLAPTAVTRHEDPEFQLLAWQGTPFDVQNLGTAFQQGDLFCQVGDPKKLEAILVVDQTDVDFLKEGQLAEVNLDCFPDRIFSGKITEIANADLRVVDKRMAGKVGGGVATVSSPTTGVEKPQETSYQARVPVEDSEGLLRLGLRGQAKIYTAPETLATRLWRLLTHTLHFRI